MQSVAANEILGSQTPQAYMKIQYCGGWGYRKHAIPTIEEIEKNYP